MTIGMFSFPIGVVVFFASVTLAMIVAKIVGRGNSDADSVILNTVLAGLVVARVSFVLHYLPSYEGHIIRMIDFRDLGFDTMPGAVAGAIKLLWVLKRKPKVRRAAMIAVAVGVVSWSAGTAAASGAPKSAKLPDVRLVNNGGSAQSLARIDGKPLVVNLWATWCAPCRAEIPALVEAQHDIPEIDLMFVNQGESRTTIKDFVESEGITIPNLLLDPTLALAKAVDARAFPTTLFYDAQGNLLAVHLGPFSQATFQQAIHKLYPDVAQSTKPS
jgi:YD repeat-containing protein